MDPTGFVLAVRRTNDELHSARPDAPVVNDQRSPRPSRIPRVRLSAAAVLHRLANKVEPPRVTECMPST